MQTSTAKSTLHSAASRRARFVVLALALILVGAAAISLLLGRYPIDPAQAVAMFVSKIVPVDPIWTEQQATLFFNVRLPRILHISISLSDVSSSPSNWIELPGQISPIVGRSRMMDKEVTLFPQPDSPTIPKISPLLTSKFTPSTATTEPLRLENCVFRFCT